MPHLAVQDVGRRKHYPKQPCVQLKGNAGELSIETESQMIVTTAGKGVRKQAFFFLHCR